MLPKLPTADEARTIGLDAVRFLADDPARMAHFLAETGLSPDDLRASLSEDGLLAGVLAHILSDDGLVLTFATSNGLEPERIAMAQAVLSGRSQEMVST